MKKNISKLVAQVEQSASATRKEAFKVTSRNANQYVNKILVDSEDYNRPDIAEDYVSKEMKLYRMDNNNQSVNAVNHNVKQKTEKPRGIEHQLNLLEKNYNLLALEELIAAMRVARKEEMLRVRDKLTKLENSLSFHLENEDLEPHLQESLTEFLEELTTIINKTNKIY